MTLKDALSLLASKRNSMRCDELKELLEDLGFVTKQMKVPNHYTYTHAELQKVGFTTGTFACEHGRNGRVKIGYISNVRRTLETYAEILREL